MGMRAQIEVVDSYTRKSVFLYTHWGSESIAHDLAEALERAGADGRLGDTDYLTRMIFCQMLAGVHDPFTGTTGLGIGTEEHLDLEFPPLRVWVKPGVTTVTFAGMVEWTADQFIRDQRAGKVDLYELARQAEEVTA